MALTLTSSARTVDVSMNAVTVGLKFSRATAPPAAIETIPTATLALPTVAFEVVSSLASIVTSPLIVSVAPLA